MSTYVLKPKDIVEKWHVVDATDRALGRIASEVAATLQPAVGFEREVLGAQP